MSLHPTGRGQHNDRANSDPSDPAIITKTPRSPGPNKLTSFFGWKTSSPIAEASPTSFSDRSHSPQPSPLLPSPHSFASSKSVPRAIDTSKANATMENTYLSGAGFPLPPRSNWTASAADVEDELREVSTELAGSIRRELELEDLVDRLQLEASQGPELGRRTSDYFSDSGSGSYRYGSDAGTNKADDLAKQKRISEQEKAQFKLSMNQKLQNERSQRKLLEAHVQQLEDQMQHVRQFGPMVCKLFVSNCTTD